MTSPSRHLDLGARWTGSGTHFRVWAPHVERLSVRLDGRNHTIPMTRTPSGHFTGDMPDARPGDRYVYLLNGTKARPDPASRFQPEGVHGPSVIVDPAQFAWSDGTWHGLPLDALIIYELHIGTFTTAGTFESAMSRLPFLKNLGVTAIEIMPVAQFPGARNWGYDGVGLYAPQSTYGGPDGLKTLINACHLHGLAVILDVVYNHLGPEGNYLEEFGPYFTDRYRTPWGRAVNYDGPDSDEVRHFVMSNAVYWVTEYHVDALRLDAIHGIYDFGATHILKELADAVHEQGKQLGRTVLVIGESDLNDARVISPAEAGGYGLDGQWSDDFHHAMHACLTHERAGYYEDFGRLEQVATALQDGFVYAGRYSAHRRRRHGNSARHRPPQQLVICTQNHDQVGNRAQGERLSQLIPWSALKVAAATLVLAPQTPMLFMGEEYGETAPFQYFIDHSDPDLIEAVRQGRRREFASFGWTDVPDPYDVETFTRSRLQPNMPEDPRQSQMLAWYQFLIGLRKDEPGFRTGGRHTARADENAGCLILHRHAEDGAQGLLLANVRSTATALRLAEPKAAWTLLGWSWSSEFGGTDSEQPQRSVNVRTQQPELRLPAFGVLIYRA